MNWNEYPEADKRKLEIAVKERFAAHGFDPDGMWAWQLRVWTGKPVTLRELQMLIISELRRRGWMAEANLDYEPEPVSEKDDIPLAPDGDWEIRAWPNFGGSEGIYLDWKYVGRYRDWSPADLPSAYGLDAERIDPADPSKGYKATYGLYCAKTLDENLAGMERMSLLCGRILWLINAIPV